jgi:anti-anti-sigma factor
MVTVERRKDVIVVSGQIDAGSAEEFDARCSKLADEIGGDVTLDMTGVLFIGSSGIGALIALRTRLLRRKRNLTVIPSRPVLDVLEVAGLDEVVDLV